VEAMKPTSQLLQHVVVVRRHFVWLSCISVSTCFPSAVTLVPSSSPDSDSAIIPIDNNSSRGHTTVGASENNNGAQGSMRVQLQRRMCDGGRYSVLIAGLGLGSSYRR
jgi:hypothetical protein